MRLGYGIASGNFLLVCGGFVLIFTPLRYIRAAPSESLGAALLHPTFIAMCVLAVGGGTLSLRAEFYLKRGVNEDRWLDAELSTLRTWMNDFGMAVAVWIPPAICVIVAFASQRWRDLYLINLFLLPVSTRMRVKSLLWPVRPNLLQDPSGLRTLQSEHWGQRS
jgi:hypothetical protein